MKKVRYNQKTHEQFIEELKTKHPKLFNSIKIISQYNKCQEHILVETKYGKCLVNPLSLLKGYPPTIQIAVNKTEYFKNVLKESQPEVLHIIEIIGEYISDKNRILVKTKYGNCLIRPNDLLQGHTPSIRTAVNQQEYFINQAKEVHGDLYDYSLVDYKDAHTKIKIISSEGVFEQVPNHHLCGSGCPILGRESITKYHQNNPQGWDYTNWEIKGNCSEHFDSFKLYVVRCYNENETFYKIGKTYNSLQKRFCGKNMPYNYEVVEILVSDARTISELEWNLKNKNKDFKYIPEIKFGGRHECFSSINNLIIKRELI